jgi:hypothetical protein
LCLKKLIPKFKTFEKLKDFLVTIFFDYKKLFPRFVIASSFLHIIASSSLAVIASPFFPVIVSSFLHVIARSEATKQSPYCSFLLVLGVLVGLLRLLRSLAMTPLSVIAMAQPEAISSLHIPFSIKCFEGIASPDCHQARNDVVGLKARNGIAKTLLITLQRS